MNNGIISISPDRDLEVTKTDSDIDTLFDPISTLLEHMDLTSWSLMVNYNLKGYDHFATTYPEEWVTEYINKNYAFLDPTLQWAMFRQGAIRWSDNKIPDALGVLKKAKKYGLNFGVTFSRKTGQKRTALFVAKSLKELSDEEIHQISDMMAPFYEDVTPTQKLTSAEIEAVGYIVEGSTLDEIAQELGISASAIKTRLATARAKMKCKNNAQLIYKAMQENLLN